MSMDFRFTISIEGLGAVEVAEDSAEAMLDAFERTHPEVGASVGANLEAGLLEVAFCASGHSLNDAADNAGKIFIEAALASELQPAPVVGLEVEADLAERPRPKLPLLKRRRGADAWTMPRLAHSA
jgi:hypothetical protein